MPVPDWLTKHIIRAAPRARRTAYLHSAGAAPGALTPGALPPVGLLVLHPSAHNALGFATKHEYFDGLIGKVAMLFLNSGTINGRKTWGYNDPATWAIDKAAIHQAREMLKAHVAPGGVLVILGQSAGAYAVHVLRYEDPQAFDGFAMSAGCMYATRHPRSPAHTYLQHGTHDGIAKFGGYLTPAPERAVVFSFRAAAEAVMLANNTRDTAARPDTRCPKAGIVEGYGTKRTTVVELDGVRHPFYNDPKWRTAHRVAAWARGLT